MKPIAEANTLDDRSHANEAAPERRAAAAGIVAAGALLVALAGTLLWLGIVMDPLRLATGLLDARDRLGDAENRLSQGQIRPARYEILAGAAAARRARSGLESSPLLDLALVVPKAGPVVREADHFVAAAELSSRAAQGTLEIVDSALSGEDSILAKDPDSETGGLIRIDRIEDVAATVDEVRDALIGARRELAAIDLGNLPRRLRKPVVNGIADADKSQELLVDVQRGLALLPSILGVDEPRTYLIGMLNYAELRGSGGALLQYAMLNIDQGTTRLLSPESVYEIDRQREQLSIPLPEDAWYVEGIPDAQRFGNANWSPHWPLSARLTVEYARARVPTFPEVDGFIAMTPSVLQHLVQSTGPFRTKWGNRITARNAVPFLVHDAYGKFPKFYLRRIALRQVVDGFFERMLRPQYPSQLLKGMARGLTRKDVQIWMADEAEQEFIDSMNWDGGIPPAKHGDYLGVVQQNVGGNKLDYFAEQATNVTVSLDESDALVSTEVEIYNGVYMPQARWAMGNSGPLHRPMVNVYVREDAQLESAAVAPETCSACASYLVGNKATGKAPAPALGRIDSPEPARWVDGRPAEHTEVGKKVWSATLQVPPQETAAFELRYRVPEVVESVGERKVYRLVLQHQPKTRPDVVGLRVELPEGATGIKATSGVDALAFVRDGNVLIWDHPLNKDVELEVSWRGP